MEKPKVLYNFISNRLSAEVSIHLASEWEHEGVAKLNEIENLIEESICNIGSFDHWGYGWNYVARDTSITVIPARSNGHPSVRAIFESHILRDDRIEAWKTAMTHLIGNLSIELGNGLYTYTIFFSDGTSFPDRNY